MAFKLKNAADVKFYLYISKSKLQMLFQQIGRREDTKRTVEWKGTVAVGSVLRKVETDEDLDEDDMLRAVITELEDARQVGSIHEPNLYIKGVMPMRWGLYNDAGTRPEEESPLVYFGGLDNESCTLLGLGGSSKHVVGHNGATSTYSRSVTPALVRALLDGLEYPVPARPEWWDKRAEEDEVYTAVAVAQHYLRPPTQNLEFFGKTLMTGEAHGCEHFIGIPKANVILATPLYVAMAAPLPEDDHWGTIPD